jgi:hypothetical protein
MHYAKSSMTCVGLAFGLALAQGCRRDHEAIKNPDQSRPQARATSSSKRRSNS